MPSLVFYILKLSVALAAVYLFYQLLLRRLTFYNWNRWYLIIYSAIAFLIPFINITPVLEKNEWTDSQIIGWVPALNENAPLQNANGDKTALSFFTSNATVILLVTGMLFLFARLIIQFISFNRMKKKAVQFSENGLTIYQVDQNIIPFSFGNSIFINKQLHSEEELREIIRHEFIHVKQKHSIDIIWSELLCLFNWYNPFAWLLKRAIRQNLEFIADNKVIENGLNKKEYQYLLLKVTGNTQYSIATQFNFSSLKKRIAMMNKLKSAKVHMLKFLFLLPLVATLLLAFRKYNAIKTNRSPQIHEAIIVIDNDTRKPIEGVIVTNLNTLQVKVTDTKGYFSMELPANRPIHVDMKYNKPGYNEFTTHSFSLEKESNTESFNLVEVVVLKKGSPNTACVGCNNSVKFETIKANNSVAYQNVLKYYDKLMQQHADTIPHVKTPNSKGYYIDVIDNQGNCTIVIKDKDKKEVKRLLLTEWNEKTDYYENLYGEIPPAPMAAVEERIKAANPGITKVVVKNNIATVTLKSGKTETYNLSLKPEKRAYEERCGIREVAIAPTVALTEVRAATAQSVTTPVEERITTTVAEPVNVTLAAIADDFEITSDKAIMHLKNGKTEEYNLANAKEKQAFEKKYGKIISPVSTTTAINAVTAITGRSAPSVLTTVSASPISPVTVINADEDITGDEDLLVTITKNTKPEELESLVKKMKEKGYELKITNKDYEDGILTQISGTVTYKDSNSSFTATDFNRVTISTYLEGKKVRFKIFIGTKKAVS